MDKPMKLSGAAPMVGSQKEGKHGIKHEKVQNVVARPANMKLNRRDAIADCCGHSEVKVKGK